MSEPVVCDGEVAPEKKMKQEHEEEVKKKQEETPQKNTNRPLRAAAPFKKRLMNEIFLFIGAVTILIGFSFAFAAVYSWADKHFNDGRGSISVYKMAMELFLRPLISAIPLLFIILAYFRLKFPEIN